jgi:hypothetical protein
MSGGLVDPYWYRVRGLRPSLRSHVEIHRQEYRGERWYLLHDAASGRHHRFSPAAYCMIALIDGRRTLEERHHADRDSPIHSTSDSPFSTRTPSSSAGSPSCDRSSAAGGSLRGSSSSPGA